MKRVFVYRNKTEENGRVLPVEESLLEFLKNISTNFQIPLEEVKLFTNNGCEINDTRVIRDNETIYLAIDEKVDNLVSSSDKSDQKNEKYENHSRLSNWILLNVGGKYFSTSRSTLTMKEPMSMLARMFSEENRLINPSAKDSSGAYLIDRSPEYFEPILNYLRHGNVILDKHVNPKGVLEEAIFYGIESMIPHLNILIEQLRNISDCVKALTRNDVVRILAATTIKSVLRFQGVNLEGADLSKLDLRNINFKHACLSKCNLSGANLDDCLLERADLSYANLEGAQLVGVKALCANFEGANLKDCNMESLCGSREIVMEGVNMKGANLEGSNMAGVNLRVATLKNANLQNCDLRFAVLAGANLEFCNLSGSDLHEANLRGANLKDVAFGLMLTPLHMSQTIG